MSDASNNTRKWEGCVRVIPGPAEVFVDLDTQQGVDEFFRRFDRMLEVYPESAVKWTTSVSGNWHAYVTVRPLPCELTNQWRAALQAALGSDPMREILAVNRFMKGTNGDPEIFFWEREGFIKTDAPHGTVKESIEV